MAAGDVTQGRRLPDCEPGELSDDENYRGAYWRSGGIWYCSVRLAGSLMWPRPVRWLFNRTLGRLIAFVFGRTTG